LYLIADKWTALVILSLARNTRRDGKVRREIGGVSQKMLTQTLRNLENSGLLKTLCNWASEHFHEVELARAEAVDSKKLDPVIA
jgi:HxlR-like helix-turn-helix